MTILIKVDKMTILIYHIDTVDGKPKAIEYGRFNDNKVTGKISIDSITEDEVKRTFNSGYWRTSELEE